MTAMPAENAAVMPLATAWQRIAETIRTGIDEGLYPTGATLPASIELAQIHGVHRHTIRQAYRYLAEQGLVTVERGRGTRVTGRRFPYRLGRRVSLRTNFAAAGINVRGELINRSIIEAPAPVRAALGLAAGARVWRIRIVNFAGEVPVSTGVHMFDLKRFPDLPEQLLAADASITGALKSAGVSDYNRISTRLSARFATERECTLLQLPNAAPVLQSTGLDALSDMTPIHLVEGVFAGDRMEMVIEPFADS